MQKAVFSEEGVTHLYVNTDMISTYVNEEKKILELSASCTFHNYQLSTSEKLLSGSSPCKNELWHFGLHGQNVNVLDLN